MIQKLPESVYYLCNLQMIILRGCSRFNEFPSKMKKMINIHYFDILKCNSLIEMSTHGIDKLKSL